jgi:integrase
MNKVSRFAFTKGRLEKLEAPAEGVAYHYDTVVCGLRLAVHPATAAYPQGKRTFNLYKKFRLTHGPITLPLGVFPQVSVEQARREAGDKIAMMARGENPRDELKALGEVTLGEFFERYLLEHRVHGAAASPTHRHDARKTFDRCLAAWAARPLSRVLRSDVEQLHTETVKARGPCAANRLLALISSIFTEARNWGLHHGDNPARGIEKVAEYARTRLLERRNGELARFRRALQAEKDPDLRLYLILRLFNGIRESNILGMRWADLDLGQRRWLIGKTKNDEPLWVPLSTPAVRELRRRGSRSLGDGKNPSEFVFAGRRHGTHLTTLNKPWRKFRSALELDDIELRDLRRTFGSRMLAAGVPMDVIAQAMGHKPGSKITASVYALADMELKREAVTATTRKMLAEAGDERQQGV